MTETNFRMNTLSEVTAINTALHQVLVALAKSQPDPHAFLKELSERGCSGIEQINLWGGSPEQLAAVREGAMARYMDIMTCAGKAID